MWGLSTGMECVLKSAGTGLQNRVGIDCVCGPVIASTLPKLQCIPVYVYAVLRGSADAHMHVRFTPITKSCHG